MAKGDALIKQFNPSLNGDEFGIDIGIGTRTVTCANGNTVTCDVDELGCEEGSITGPCQAFGDNITVTCANRSQVTCPAGSEGCANGSITGPCQAFGDNITVTCANRSQVTCPVGSDGCFEGSSIGVCARNQPVGGPRTIICGNQPLRTTTCNSGTLGCFNGSTEGVCASGRIPPGGGSIPPGGGSIPPGGGSIPPAGVCNNTIPQNVRLVTDSSNTTFSGTCSQQGSNLVCSFSNYCGN